MTSQPDRSFARPGWITATLLALTLVLGGGGSPSPLPEMVLQIATIGLFALWFVSLPAPFGQIVPPRAWLIVVLVLTVPLVQLLPLPPALWQALPGRELARDALALIGRDNTWRPLSLEPGRTVASLLAMACACALLLMTAAMPARSRWILLVVIAATGFATMLLGAAQISGPIGGPLYFYGADAPVLAGFQANRNSTADVLLIAMIAAIALVRHLAQRNSTWSRPGVIAGALGLTLVFTVGAALTGSRAGVVLLVVAYAAGLAILRPWLAVSRTGIAAAAMAIGLIGVIALNNPALGRVAQRFDLAADARTEIWRDSAYVARFNAPAGVGMGGFFSAYIAAERLEAIGRTVPNRAHNDYLELAVEAGALGLAVLAACGALIVSAAAASLRTAADPDRRVLVLFAVFALALIALHSLVDYPLRSMSLAGLAACCVGMLFPPAAVPLHRVQATADKGPA